MAEKLSESDSRNAVTGFLPALAGERTWAFGGMTYILVAYGIASWTFLTGGYIGSVLAAKEGVGALLFGNAGGLFIILPIVLITSRYGIDTFVLSRSSLGYRGNDIFTILFLGINTLWTTVTSFMVGSSVAYLISIPFPDSWLGSRTGGAFLFTTIVWFVSLWLAYKGPNYLETFSKISVIAMFVMVVGLLVYVFTSEGSVFGALPASPYANPNRGVLTAVEWSFGSAIGYLPYVGQYARLAKRESTAVKGYYYGAGILVLGAAVLGLFTSLLTGAYDPVLWLTAIGGAGWGILGLVLIALANLTSTALLLYSQGVVVRSRWPRVPWKWALATALPAVVMCWNSAVYDGFNKLLTFQAIFYGVIAAVMVADVLIVRRYRVYLIELYDQKGTYGFVGGFNIPAFVSMGLGAVVYLQLYNPLTDTAYSSWFTYIGAGFPSFFATAAIYVVLAYACSRVSSPATRLRLVGPLAFEKPVALAAEVQTATADAS